MTTTIIQFVRNFRGAKLLIPLVSLGALLFGSGCRSNLYSRALDNSHNTDLWSKNFHKSFGKKPLVRYYLPIPYVEVVIYEVKRLGINEYHPVFRATAIPDVDNPILLTDDHLFSVEHGVKIELSREGFLSRVAYDRKPQGLDAIGVAARAVLSAMSPVPLPFKGDPDFPEFSRVVFRKSFPLADLVAKGQPVWVGGDLCMLNATVVAQKQTTPGSLKNSYAASLGSADSLDLKSRLSGLNGKGSPGILHRPLVPVNLTLVAISNTPSMSFSSQGLELRNSPTAPDAFLKILPEGPGPFLLYSNGDTRVALNPSPAALEIEEIVYCADPRQVDLLPFSEVWFASQEADFRFQNGSVTEVRTHREAELMAVVNALLGPANSVTATASGIFTVNVHHDGERPSSGDKGTRGGGNQQPKE